MPPARWCLLLLTRNRINEANKSNFRAQVSILNPSYHKGLPADSCDVSDLFDKYGEATTLQLHPFEAVRPLLYQSTSAV